MSQVRALVAEPMKNTLIIVGIVIILVGGIYWSKSLQSNDPNIISTRGLHWHPIVEIYVKGEKQVIPPNIGTGPQYSSLSMGMTPVHTHDDATQGIIHLEFSGLVRKEDITLGQFFKIWGKDINSFGSNLRMTINGVENTELESYVMQDKDKIELRYE